MKDSKVKLYPSEKVIEDFYEALPVKVKRNLKRFIFLNQMCSIYVKPSIKELGTSTP